MRVTKRQADRRSAARQRSGRQRRLAAIVIACVASTALVGCSKVADKVAETAVEKAAGAAANANVDINTKDGELKVESSEGSFNIGGDMPEDFPEAMPLPDYDKVVTSNEIKDDTGTSYSVVLQSSTSYDDLVSFYDDAFDSGDWTVKQRSQSSGDLENTTYMVSTDQLYAIVNVQVQDDGQLVSVNVGPNNDNG